MEDPGCVCVGGVSTINDSSLLYGSIFAGPGRRISAARPRRTLSYLGVQHVLVVVHQDVSMVDDMSRQEIRTPSAHGERGERAG